MKPESSLLAESDSSSSGSSGLTSREFLEDLRVLSLVSKPEVSHLSPSSSLSTIWLRSQHLSHRTKEMYIFASMSCDNVTGRHLSLIYLNDCFSWTPIPGKVWGGKEPTHDINICICDVMWCDVMWCDVTWQVPDLSGLYDWPIGEVRNVPSYTAVRLIGGRSEKRSVYSFVGSYTIQGQRWGLFLNQNSPIFL